MTTGRAAPQFMLDTNAVSDAIKNPRGAVANRLTQLLPGQAVISVIVEGELRYGIAKASATSIERRLNALLAYIDTLSLDAQTAARYGQIRAELAQQGTPIGMNDLWIGAHALQHNLVLVTDNETEFRRVRGLAVENWQRTPPQHD